MVKPVRWRWGGRLFAAVLALMLLPSLAVALGWLALLASINRAQAPVSEHEARAGFHRGVQWFQAHEAEVLADGNSALWWMLRAAAQNSRDPYLSQLVDRHLAEAYTGRDARLAWKRVIVGDADFEPIEPLLGDLKGYQRFFLRAVTCRPGEEADADTRRFISEHVCRPSLTRVWLSDRVCTTHQLMGLMLYRRQGCHGAEALDGFKQELIDDIATQASWDVFMHDGQIQRVLTLVWSGASHRVHPGWVRRILAQQRHDGGWTGHSLLPELPEWVQVPALKQAWRRLMGQPPLPPVASDFHATAQGLLLMSLLAPAQQLLTADGS